jgi:hypothetical protein
MRGTGNSVITRAEHNNKWVLDGANISCQGNIETLLDYQIVANNGHPSMSDDCYRYMFLDCVNLI